MQTSRFILGSRSNSSCLCWVPGWSVCIAVCALLLFNSFSGSLHQIYSVVIKQILNSCIQISHHNHHNFKYLLHIQFKDSFSLKKMFRRYPLCSSSIRQFNSVEFIQSNSFFERLPIGVWLGFIDGWLNQHFIEVIFFSAVE